MSLQQELTLSFQYLNITLKQPELRKCEELCQTYKIDAEDFVDQWMAYTASNLHGAPPTTEALEKMERKELQKLGKTTIKAQKTVKTIIVEDDYNSGYVKSVLTPPKKDTQIGDQVYNQETTTITSQIQIIDTPTQQFIERQDSRRIQCELLCSDPPDFMQKLLDRPLEVKVENYELMKDSRYMYEKFLLRREAVNNSTRWVIGQILKHYNLDLTLEKIKEYSGEMVICGRIYSDSPGKLNVGSILLEGTLETYRGQTIKLNVDNLDNFALFNGQVVVVKGNNLKSRFFVKEIYTGAPLVRRDKLCPVIPESVQIVIASGPFTLPDNLLYEPLTDLLKYITEFKPNLVILTGPFIDGSNGLIETMNEAYDHFFQTIIDGIMESVKDCDTQVVLIPSTKDVHNHVIFPTLPFRVKRKPTNLTLPTNPCVLEIDGARIGVCSTDILFHISKNEVFRGDPLKVDRMSRLAGHLLKQRSFYPLSPPDPDVRIDCQMLEKFGMFEDKLDLLVLPSSLRYFVKKVDGCLIVNPERLSKGSTAGTFARVDIRGGQGDVCDRTSCQILRV